MIVAAWQGAPWFAGMGIEPIYAMAAGVMVGGVLQLAVQIPALPAWACCRALAWRWSALRAAWAGRWRAQHRAADAAGPAGRGCGAHFDPDHQPRSRRG
jgi:hypothetical protein